MISLYKKKRKEGKSVLYSVEYIRQYYKRIENGNNQSRYAKKLATSFEKYVLEGLSQEEGRKKALEENHIRGVRKKCSKVIDSELTSSTLKRKSDGLDSEPPEKKQKVSTPLGYGLEIDLDVDSSEESEIESGTESESELETESSSDERI